MNRCWVGPANSTNSSNAQARNMLMSDITRTPFSTPATATATAAPIMRVISATCTHWVWGMPNR
ncbi:hypothetical protein D3C87_1857080 [compost metagenome]